MRDNPVDWIVPDWSAPFKVKALVTTRNGGLSTGPYASLNLGLRVNDDPAIVGRNRALLRNHLPAEPRWLQQVHGNRVVDAARVEQPVEADAATSRTSDTVCAVMVADCMPVFLADRGGTVVGAAHAGWRGLAAGVIENTVQSMAVAPSELVAWLGPAIGPTAFEVGADVRNAFVGRDAGAATAFIDHKPGKWLADIYALARRRLHAIGVIDVYGGNLCTVSEPRRFYSHRRDRITGRMAALIWLSA
jgi:YfiH family protein